MPRRTRILLFSTLYPNSVRPGHGIFVETRLRHLLMCEQIEARVVAPVPWFPFRHRVFGDYGEFAAVPSREERNGTPVEHPRYVLLPKIGMNWAPVSLAKAGLAVARGLIASGYDFDLIDAHYFYPDGVAATIIGRVLGKPVVITARGSDINLIARCGGPRRQILEASRYASAIIAVSAALRDSMIAIGVDREKISVLGNGVDAALFYPEDGAAARSRWGVGGLVLVSVGNLIPLKGHDIVIRAIARLPDAQLLIAGQGPERQRLELLATSIGIGDRIRFVGHLAQPDLRSLYSAADCLVLASEREGCPNVLLEAMACGTPVVATRVGGIPDIITTAAAGRLIDDRNPTAIVEAVGQLRTAPEPRAATRAYAERFGWREISLGQMAVFRDILGCGESA
jgi:glycosyltransferase involved in cell wall biosynthesis